MPVNWFVYDNTAASEIESIMATDRMSFEIAAAQLKPGRCHFALSVTYLPLGSPDPPGPIDGYHIGSCAISLLPISRGWVALDPEDPTGDVVVDGNYNATDADKVVLRTAVRRLMKVIESPGLREEVECGTPPPGGKPLTSTSSDEDIEALIRATAQTWHHPMDTVAMGKAVDSVLRFIGVHNLRIVDASVFPSPISANQQATVYICCG